MPDRLDAVLERLAHHKSELPSSERDAIAMIIEAMLEDEPLTPSELAALDRQLAEGFEPADPSRVEAIRRRQGV